MPPEPHRRLKRWVQRAIIGIAAVAIVATVAACGGGSDSSSSETGSSEAGGSTDSSSSGGSSLSEASVGAKFTGGKVGAADESKSPIKVGWINWQGGTPLSFPESTEGTEAAVEYINNDLGGIEGHPLEIVECYIASAEEEGQKCGQEIRNDPSIDLLVLGSVQIGTESLYATLKGEIPTIGANINSIPSLTAENAYFMSPGFVGVGPSYVTWAKEIAKVKTISLLGGNDPESKLAEKLLAEEMGAEGIKVKIGQYNNESAELVPALNASDAANSEAILSFAANATQCVATTKAITQLGLDDKPIMGLPFCVTPEVQDALGGEYPKWTYWFPVENPEAPDGGPDVTTYNAAMDEYAPDANRSLFAALSFSAWMTAAKVMNEIGAEKLSPEAINSKLKAFGGPGFMTAPEFNFGSIKSAPTAGSLEFRTYTYEGGENWSHTDWQAPVAESPVNE